MHEQENQRDREGQESESSPSQPSAVSVEAQVNMNQTGKDNSKQDIENTLKNLNQSFQESLHQPKFILELAGFVVLSVYAGYTIAMYYANRESANAAQSAAVTANQALSDSRSNFIAEQRPILWLTDDIGAPRVFKNPHDQTSGQLLWTWHFTNYGKTPPQHFRYKDYFKLGSAAPVQSYGGPAESIGAPIPPGKKDFATVVSDPMRLTAINDLISNGQVRILVVMNYTDITHTAYETGICLERTNAGSIAYCREGNYIH